MSDPTWIEEPEALVRLDRSLAIVLFDAARVDRASLEARVGSSRDARNALEATTLLYQMHADEDAIDLSPLYLEEADEGGVWSMVDLIDDYREIHSVTSARRDGARVTLEVFVDDMYAGEGAHTLGPGDALVGHVSCDLEALRAALDAAKGRLMDTLNGFARVRAAGAGTPRSAWIAWSNDPNGIIRSAVIENPHAHDDAIVLLADRRHVWEVIRRKRLPARALELAYETGQLELPEYAVTHADAPDSLLERAIADARGSGRYDAATKVAAKAHAILTERKLAAGADLDDAFGDLRSLLEATPSEETGAAVFSALQAALAREPARVAERWVPYARERMRGWERQDCTLPSPFVRRWVRHRELSPAWGIARVLAFQRHVAGAPESAWRAFADSPHLGAVESLGVRHQVDAHALSCIARASLPSLTSLVLIHWGQPTSSPDSSVLATADWVPQLQHIMLGSYSMPADALARLFARASSLQNLTLFGVDLDASHVDAWVTSGANLQIEYLSIHEADAAEALEALARINTPKLRHIQTHGTPMTEGQIAALRDSQPPTVKIDHG